MKAHNLQEIYIEELRDMLDAERQLREALPKMAKMAQHAQLQEALEQHLLETGTHISRLQQVLQSLNGDGHAKTCDAMKGLIKEAEKNSRHLDEGSPRDAGIIAMAQKIEHYEIAGYGTLSAYARQLGYTDQDQLLQQTLSEEKMTDQRLTALAEGSINQMAAAAR